jgi:hypothetical protein
MQVINKEYKRIMRAYQSMISYKREKQIIVKEKEKEWKTQLPGLKTTILRSFEALTERIER